MNMKVLGIDYGKSKVGISFADGRLAEPLKVLHNTELDSLVKAISGIAQQLQAELIIVGKSEGKMARESKSFASLLSKFVKIPVKTFDETLSTKDAIRLSFLAGIGPKKRKKMEDAYAACILLQNYLDSLKI